MGIKNILRKVIIIFIFAIQESPNQHYHHHQHHHHNNKSIEYFFLRHGLCWTTLRVLSNLKMVGYLIVPILQLMNWYLKRVSKSLKIIQAIRSRASIWTQFWLTLELVCLIAMLYLASHLIKKVRATCLLSDLYFPSRLKTFPSLTLCVQHIVPVILSKNYLRILCSFYFLSLSLHLHPSDTRGVTTSLQFPVPTRTE